MLSKLAEVKNKLSSVFARERQKIERAACCLRLSKDRLIGLINDAEALYRAALDVLIDESSKWISKLEERIGRKGTRYLTTEWRGIWIEVVTGGTIVVWAAKSFADEMGIPYPSARVGIEPIELIAVDVRRRWAVGWHASDAFVDGKGRPGMGTTDIGQVLAWALAWPGKFRVAMRGLVVGREVRPVWFTYSLSHRAIELVPEAVGAASGDETKSPKYRLVKLLSDPLALLAYTLGDGSLSVGKSYKLRWAIAPSHMDELVEAVGAVLDGVNANCVVRRRERHMEVYVTGSCASVLARAMLSAAVVLMPIGKKLLDAVYSDEPSSKYGRLVALANWASRRGVTPRVEVCGHVFAIYFDERVGLYAVYAHSSDADEVAEHVRRCLGVEKGVSIATQNSKYRMTKLSTTALETALRRLAKEDPAKARQTIQAIIEYLLKRAEEYEARGKTKAAQKARNKAKQLHTFLQNIKQQQHLTTYLQTTNIPGSNPGRGSKIIRLLSRVLRMRVA